MVFGERVIVSAQAVPIYGSISERMERNGPAKMGWQPMKGSGEYHLSDFTSKGSPVTPGDDGGWPGVAVPDDGTYARSGVYALEPTGGRERRGNHRRIRRLPLEAEGLVVGWTVRHEGTYEPGHPASGAGMFGEPDDPEPPWLASIRRVKVVQVALAVDRGPARVVDVWTGDLEVEGP